MKALLDTYTFLWWIANDAQLSLRARQIIEDSATELFLSVASGWEIAIKSHLGKLRLPPDLQGFVALRSGCLCHQLDCSARAAGGCARTAAVRSAALVGRRACRGGGAQRCALTYHRKRWRAIGRPHNAAQHSAGNCYLPGANAPLSGRKKLRRSSKQRMALNASFASAR